MPSKLKKRRLRRLKADVVWWREEAKHPQARVMDQADEIERNRSLVLGVPMPLIVPKDMAHQLYHTDTKICRTCNDGLRSGCSSCSFYKP